MRQHFGFLCLNVGGLLAAGWLTTASAQEFTEIQVTPTALGDIEFDWGRDGIDCPTCNGGNGNSRLNWTDRRGNLWIGHLDAASGNLISPDAQDELADTNAFFWNVYGNGPEWTFSTKNGQVVSQLVYTRHQPGQPAKTGYAGAAFATFSNGAWVPRFLPGAIGQGSASNGTNNSNLPEGSQCNSDPVATVIYKNFATPKTLYTEPVAAAAGTVPTATPFGPISNGIGQRFVPCTHQLLFQGAAPPGPQGHIFQQVFWYDMDTRVMQQLTTDATTKYGGFMFRAPDFDHNYIMVTVANRLTINVYQQSGTLPNGAPSFALVKSISSPDADTPYINSSEPFINCTPECTTYAYMTVAKTPDAQNGITTPIGLAVAALSPANPTLKLLAAADYTPPVQRLDPEYFITANGPYLYYNRIQVASGSTNYKNLGLWYIDMQLGAPSGSCVGSSAEGGLMPGC